MTLEDVPKLMSFMREWTGMLCEEKRGREKISMQGEAGINSIVEIPLTNSHGPQDMKGDRIRLAITKKRPEKNWIFSMLESLSWFS
jgi:hypothetical protein